MVFVAAVDSRPWRNRVWNYVIAFGDAERAQIAADKASRATIYSHSGNRILGRRDRWRRRALSSHSFNLEMITGLDLLFLEVNNLEESLEFYRDVLGFEIDSQTPDADPPIASLQSGSLRITLVQQLETMLKRGRGVHFVLEVTDVDAFYQRLRSRQIHVAEPRDEGWGGRFVSLQDPDSYRYFFVTWK